MSDQNSLGKGRSDLMDHGPEAFSMGRLVGYIIPNTKARLPHPPGDAHYRGMLFFIEDLCSVANSKVLGRSALWRNCVAILCPQGLYPGLFTTA
jgi:hypothetical protein